jgi:hypothetical protein
MYNLKKILLLVTAFLFTGLAMAQEIVVPTEDGVMRSDGKIFVVMAIVITILAGLIIYVVRLDKKISNLEKGKS